MPGNSFMKPYLFIGGIFSVFYITVGLMLCSGRLSFGMEPQVRVLVGAGVMAYGIFRAIIFYRNYKASKRDEK